MATKTKIRAKNKAETQQITTQQTSQVIPAISKRQIDEREGQLREIYNLMDTDKDIAAGKEFVFTYKDELGNDRAVNDVENYTTEEGVIYGGRVKSVIRTAEPHPEIHRVDITEESEADIEKFLEHCFYDANRNLSRWGKPPFHYQQGDYVCDRGWVAQFVALYQDPKTDKVNCVIQPMDVRQMAWMYGKDGLLWASVRQPPMTATEVKSQFGKDVTGEVSPIYLWDTQNEYVYLGETEVIIKKHGYGRVPVIIKRVGTTGESIYDKVRKTIRQINISGTIMQSINVLSWRPPVGFRSKDGKKKPAKYPAGVSMITLLAAEEGFERIPFTEMVNHCQYMFEKCHQTLQRGSLPFSEYGGDPTNRQSAVLYEDLERHRDQVFLPRVQCLAEMYIDTAWMIIEQFKTQNFQTEFTDIEGHDIVIKPDSLNGNYLLKFNISTTNPERNLANYTMAASARGQISGYTIRRKVLELEDPAREENRINDEKAEETSPALFFYRQCLRIMAEYETLKGDDQKNKFYEFKIILAKLDRALDEEAAQGMPAQVGGGGMAQLPARPAPTPALPAFTPEATPTEQPPGQPTSKGQLPQMAAISPETRVQQANNQLKAKAAV